MHTLYIEAFAGISGNMLLGALLNLGFPFAVLEQELTKLHLGDYRLILQQVNKCGIAATYFNVQLPEEHEHHHELPEGHVQQVEQEIKHVHHHDHQHEHRNYADILHILHNSTLDQKIQNRAADVFKNLAVAEAKVHGKTIEEIHFHEVGAIDTIIDVVGCILGLSYLQVDKIYISTITTGKGFVNCAHGLMPVPAPATAELLQGCLTRQGNIEKELTTPTGAALARSLMVQTGDVPESFTGRRIAYGAGTWELSIPNVLRVTLGESDAIMPADCEEKQLHLLTCNVDNLNPEISPYLVEQALQLGALDAWLTPIIMKKGRPAQQISILTSVAKLEILQKLLFTETTTLGIRDTEVKRTSLLRKLVPVVTPWGKIQVKVATLAGEIVNVAPEFEDCKAVAKKQNLPLKMVMAIALQNYYKGQNHDA